MCPATAPQSTTPRAPWFASWFDSPHYQKLYAYRDETEASTFMDALLGRLGARPGSTMLDVGCGTGRHARHLASNGFDVTGIDLSPGSIRQAKMHEEQGLRFFRHDMRAPFQRDAFDFVFNLFTSFGYFEDPGEHLTVVRNISRALKVGGRFVFDYLNVAYADAHLTPHEIREVDGTAYHITRWADAEHFFKRIVVHEASREPVEYVEQVARFTMEDLRWMFTLYGLRVEEAYGDYRLAPYDAGASPRLILIARKIQSDSEAVYLRDRLLRMRLTVSADTPRYEASIH